MGPKLSAAIWIGVYLIAVAMPMVALILAPTPAGVGFAWDLSMALGFAAITMMGVQFALTARFQRATAPFGIDVIYLFHRYMAVIAFVLLLGHAVIVMVGYPAAIGAIDPRTMSWPVILGFAGFAAFAAIIVTSLWRKPLRIEYDRWRMWHAATAVAAFALAVTHVDGVGYYIDTPAKKAIWIGFMLLWALLIVHVRLVRPWRMLRKPYRVSEIRKERGRSWTIGVEPAGHNGMNFRPGQFAWVTLRASPFCLKEHPFSISSMPTPSRRLEFTIKELGDFTGTVKNIRVGEAAYLDGPYGVFCIDRYSAAPAFVFLAGGVGIAPIMSMLRASAEAGERRPLILIYGNRTWENVIFREELESLGAKLNLTVVHVLLEPPIGWSGERGYITREIIARHLPDSATAAEYFICGPQPMIDMVERGLHEHGIPLRHVHSEIFDLA